MRDNTKSSIAMISALLATITAVISCGLALLKLGDPFNASIAPVPSQQWQFSTTPTSVPVKKTPTAYAPIPSYLSPNDFDEQDERFLFEQSQDILIVIDNLDNRLSVVEQGMLDSEDRIIEMRLLRQDIDYLRSVYSANIESIKAETERIYTFNQWFLGAVVTLSLGVLGLAFSMRKSDKPDEEVKLLKEKISRLESQIQELQKKRASNNK